MNTVTGVGRRRYASSYFACACVRARIRGSRRAPPRIQAPSVLRVWGWCPLCAPEAIASAEPAAPATDALGYNRSSRSRMR